MSDRDDDPATLKWRALAARAIALWRDEIGGTYETLQSEMGNAGRHEGAGSIAHYFRPKGRRPKHPDQILVAITKLLAKKLHFQRTDLSIEKFEVALRRHIEGEENAPLAVASPAVATKTPFQPNRSSAFDLWTPGQTDTMIVTRFAGDLGLEGAEKVRLLSRAAIDAIGRGDFATQNALAKQAIELGKDAPNTPLLGEGRYLQAESTRLLADIEPDRNAARILRREAEALYETAEEELGGDPRAIRGRARTIEVLGDLDSALTLFHQAETTVEIRSSDLNQTNRLSLEHERIRSLRHRVTCLAAIHIDAPSSTLIAQRRAAELRQHLLKSEQIHEVSLDNFREFKDWWRIEWFMAQVLHAKGWIALGETSIAAKRLLWALECRIQMIANEGELSAIETGNLHWWATTIHGAISGLEGNQERSLSTLKNALDRGEDCRKIKMLGMDFVNAGAPPWSR